MYLNLYGINSGDSSTEGDKVKIETADRTPRETLEERLEKTPSNARFFAQGVYLIIDQSWKVPWAPHMVPRS
jgi:hypothetical protein